MRALLLSAALLSSFIGVSSAFAASHDYGPPPPWYHHHQPWHRPIIERNVYVHVTPPPVRIIDRPVYYGRPVIVERPIVYGPTGHVSNGYVAAYNPRTQRVVLTDGEAFTLSPALGYPPLHYGERVQIGWHSRDGWREATRVTLL